MEDIIDTSKYARLEELNELEKELAAKAAKCASAASGASVPSNCEHKAEYEAFCFDRLGKLTAQDWIYIVEFPELQMLNENLAEYLGKMDLQSLSADDTVMLVNERPDFADKCPWEKLDGHDWSNILGNQPQFADRCAWDKLKGRDWAYLPTNAFGKIWMEMPGDVCLSICRNLPTGAHGKS